MTYKTFSVDIDSDGIALVTIGPRVTAAAGSGWASVTTAPVPDDAALLAQAHALCQDAAQ